MPGLKKTFIKLKLISIIQLNEHHQIMRLYDDKQTVNIYSSPGVSLDVISSSRKVMF